MIFNKELFDDLTEKAKESPRLRFGMDMRTTPDDKSQRLLNALEPGTVMPIHRHQNTTETAVVLRGSLKWFFYDEEGKLTDTFLLEANGDMKGISVPKGLWHSIECLESGTILFEAKDGPWKQLTNNDIIELKK
jgi:cupin fold WbuC family metalloprotein